MSGSDNCTLPTGWSSVKLSDVLVPAENVTPQNAFSGEFTYIDIEAIDNKSQRIVSPKRIEAAKAPSRARRKVAKGDVLFSLVRPYLKNIAVVEDDSAEQIASTAFIVCRPSEAINTRFLFHFLRQDFFIQSITTYGDSPPAGHDDEFIQLPIRLAPMEEQERIVDALDELLSDLDSGVEALKGAKAKLERYHASVLKAAVEGDLTAEWRKSRPNAETASVFVQRILKERRHKWEQGQLRKFAQQGRKPPASWKMKYKEPVAPDTSELPSLPAGWCWSSLGQCFEVRVGATPSRQEPRYWGSGIPWVASGEVQFCTITSTRETITELGLENTSTQINPTGSVLLNMIGEGRTRGKAGILAIDACNNQNCAAIWVPETPIPTKFIYYWLLFRYEETRQLGSGNNQPAMNSEIVKGIPVPLAPLEELEAVVELLDGQLSVLEYLFAEIEKLEASQEALRQAVLRHAFSGNLVAQNPHDEPAIELLKRIAAERAARAKKSASKRTRNLARRRKQLQLA